MGMGGAGQEGNDGDGGRVVRRGILIAEDVCDCEGGNERDS